MGATWMTGILSIAGTSSGCVQVVSHAEGNETRTEYGGFARTPAPGPWDEVALHGGTFFSRSTLYQRVGVGSRSVYEDQDCIWPRRAYFSVFST